jgi:hypothetical protein
MCSLGLKETSTTTCTSRGKKKVAKSDILSLSEHQLQRIQENKMKALAKLASNGRQAISVSVNAEGNTIVEGSVTLQGRSIEVIAPPVMADIPQWLAAQNLTMTESYEGLQETYIPGDAITRVITMEVEGNPAMMLPEVEFPDTEGLAVYRSPAKVYETSDRGRLVGHREQRFIYTIEQPGRYQLPGYNYHWWNLAAGEKEVINLPALIIGTEGVAGVASEVSESGVAEVASDNIDMLLAYLLFAIVVLLMVLSLARSGLKQLWLVRQEKSRRNAVFIDAIKSQQPILALQALYHLLECQQQFKGLTTLDAVFAADNQCLQLLNRLKRQAYCSGEPKSLTVAEANMILRYLNQRSEKQWPWNEPVVISLNH